MHNNYNKYSGHTYICLAVYIHQKSLLNQFNMFSLDHTVPSKSALCERTKRAFQSHQNKEWRSE